MITLFVGHRGVGKSSLLNRIENYFQRAGLKLGSIYDLDREIELRVGKSIGDIFSQEGEAVFRQYEEKYLVELLSEGSTPMFIALGAGYGGPLPSDARVIWLRRPSDEMGRIFLDRPRLQREKTAMQEYLSMKPARDEKYQRQSQLSLFLREGVEEEDEGEYQFFTDNFLDKSGILTLQSGMNSLVLDLPFEKVEVRDDLLSEVEFTVSMLRARRAPETWFDDFNDWPLELGPVPTNRNPQIISVHEYQEGENIEQLLARLEELGKETQLKAAPEVKNFNELLKGCEWQRRDPEKRSFLPRSKDGRWKWFRLFMKGKMPLNFWRLDAGSAPDQPTMIEWFNQKENPQAFAAVLGDPVAHSRTPVEQESFFSELGWPVYAIRIKEEEWEETLPVLQILGLQAAAVTAPLKHHAYLSSDVKTLEAEDLQAVNTLVFKEGTVLGHNTDLAGFKKSIEGQEIPGPVAIWGGGGTLSLLLDVFEEAVSFSARSGKPRVRRDLSEFRPKTLVWACGRHDSYKWPLHDWNLELVLDLNYAENSMGRELAQALGCRYISGLPMFKAQAAEQRRYWSSFWKS